MEKIKIYVLLGVITCTLGFVSVRMPEVDAFYNLWYGAVESSDNQLLYRIHREVSKTSGATADTISKFLLKTNDIEKKCRAIFVLGELGKNGDLPLLCENLKLRNPEWSRPFSEIPLIAEYPARQALVKYGPKATNYILKEYFKTSDKKKREIYISIIIDIYAQGGTLRGGIELSEFLIKKKLNLLTDVKQKEILEKEFDQYIAGEKQTYKE